MIAVKDVVSISNGSACTASTYTPSHVLTAMGLSPGQIAAATRWSWCHTTPDVNWFDLVKKIRALA
jgi:cysteine desulfurase